MGWTISIAAYVSIFGMAVLAQISFRSSCERAIPGQATTLYDNESFDEKQNLILRKTWIKLVIPFFASIVERTTISTGEIVCWIR